MVDCQPLKEKISFYIEGEVSQEEQVEIADHLKNCPACLAEAEQFQKLTKCLHLLGTVSPPDHMAPQLISSLVTLDPSKARKCYDRWPRILPLFIGIFSIPYILWLLYGFLHMSHGPFHHFLARRGFLVQLVLLIVRTFTSLFNDDPLMMNFRIPLPSFSFFTSTLLLLWFLFTISIFFYPLIFSFPFARNIFSRQRN